MTQDNIGLDPVPSAEPGRWTVALDGDEIQRLEAHYDDRVSEDEWDEVRETAAKILSSCPDPSTPATATGLALGKVQSGKTLSYTALIALGIDNGYRISIVLAGTKKPLLEQNYARLSRDLETTRPDVTTFKNPLPQDGDVVRGVLFGGGHVLIVVLKNRRRLDDTRALLASPELRAFPTLVIDDEGDEASLNTQFRRGRRSAVYESILRLRDTLEHHAYLAYTATPQANLLISGIDGLSPDFGVLIEPGTGYCGGSVFFGDERDRFIRILPPGDAVHHAGVGLPEGLRQATATFFVGAAIRHLREDAAWHSMLIHNSDRRVDHEALQESIRELAALWRDTFALSETDPAAADLSVIFRAAYDDLCATVGSPPSWDDVRQRLPNELWPEVWMVNSLPLGRDPIATPFRVPNNILIGGNMLGRGVTIEGLAVTYITRRAQRDTNADTMEQRARWFGYKQHYLDLCRIFLTNQLAGDYTELLRHEDDFWDALRRNERQGLPIRDWPRMFSLDQNLGIRPTRTGVANFRQFRSSGWDIQNRLVQDRTAAARNIEAVREFFEQNPGRMCTFGNVEHQLVTDCPTEDVIAKLLAQINTAGTDWDSSYTAEYLARLLLADRLPTLDLLLVNKGDFRERSHDDGTVVNLMQGRSPSRDPTDPQFYPGDREIHGARVQLQVHLVRLRGSDSEEAVETTAFALYVPQDDPRYDLTYIVRD